MQEKSNDSTPKRPEGERALDAALVTVNLPFYIDQIKKEASWKESDRNAITLFKSDNLRLVLVALHQGAEMATHTSPGVLHIQVLEGQIRFITDQQTVELFKNQMLVLHERIPHSVKAESEAVFLLSISIC
ncbi:MAG: cupin domain-containing protein [Chitinophagales bacterium]